MDSSAHGMGAGGQGGSKEVWPVARVRNIRRTSFSGFLMRCKFCLATSGPRTPLVLSERAVRAGSAQLPHKVRCRALGACWVQMGG